ncbi:MAG: bifunctional pyr operon transcriptional regulator/uracil phosphoribosyltransferase PyrR [Verrucomicrobiota bacterium]
MSKILDEMAIERSLRRIAHEIIERNPRVETLGLIGLHTRGVPLAQRLARMIGSFSGLNEAPPVGQLDISFHRDDTDRVIAVPKQTEVPFDINGRMVVLVDDVFYTGRTIRAALNAMLDLGRPEGIQLAVLIDRGHRQLPIRADYVGKNVPTTHDDYVVVHLKETDEKDEVSLEKKGAS